MERALGRPEEVGPDGPLDARLVIVGARPGRDEVLDGKPFIGASGSLLNRLLPIPRSECYVTNVRRDFCPRNSVPTKEEIHEALPALRAELEGTTANVLLAVGGQALYALTGLDSIEAWRGSVLPSTLLPGRKVIPTYHPAACLRQYPWTYILDFDLRRALRESNYPDIRRPKRDFILDPDLGTTLNYLRELGNPISVDIETLPDGAVSCIGISDDPSRAICIPFCRGHLSVTEIATVWRALDATLRSRRIIGQNIQFDVTRLERHGFTLPHVYFDTMLAHHLLYPEFAHDLGFIVSMYTEEPYYKHEIDADTNEGFWTYNCKDAACTYEAYLGLKRELESADQWDYFQAHVMALIRPIMRMQARGFVVDHTRLHEIRRRLELETEMLQLQLNQAVGFPCNVRSTTDLRYLLHDALKLPKLKTTAGGKPSTDEDTLRQLAYRSPHADVFQKILDIRERRTLVSGFLNLEVDDDGRYKANYLIHGTDSGRLSSRAQRKGPQLQNVPKRARKVFIAGDGNCLVQGDLKRAEAMFVAYDSGERGLIELFEDNTRDLYREIAASTLSKAIEAVEPFEREVFKRVVHASNYGMGPRKFIIVLRLAGIDIAELEIRGIYGHEGKARYVIESYHQRYPHVRQWHKRIRDEVTRTRILHDAFGRRRTFLGRMDDSLHRAAFSYRPQASIVGITNQAVQRLDALGVPVLTQQHDGIIIEVRSEDVLRGADTLTKAMSIPLTVQGRTFTIPVEIKTGQNWAEMEELCL